MTVCIRTRKNRSLTAFEGRQEWTINFGAWNCDMSTVRARFLPDSTLQITVNRFTPAERTAAMYMRRPVILNPTSTAAANEIRNELKRLRSG